MFCRWCLYDLSRTSEPRCPECGGVFKPSNPETTLPTNSRWAWLQHHAMEYLAGFRTPRTRNDRMFCRECYADLRHEPGDRCSVCNTRFDRRDSYTFRRSDHMLACLHDRFRHICVWRGVLIPIVPLIIGLEAVFTQSTLLPGARRSIAQVHLLPLHGWAAVAMGVGWLGLFIVMHTRYFWHRVEPCWRYTNLATIAGTVILFSGWGYALWYAIMKTFF